MTTEVIETLAVETPKAPIVATATVNTKDFTRELEWAARFADGKSRIPILQSVSIRSHNGSISITGTDLEVGGLTAVPCTYGEDFAVTVPAKLALKYLKKVTDSTVLLAVNGTDLSIIHDEDSAATIKGISPESYPELPAMPVGAFSVDGLTDVLPRILTSISREESRYTLNGALLDIRADSEAHMVSTDGNRLSVCPIRCNTDVAARILISHRALIELERLDVDSIALTHDENHVFLVTGSRTIISRKLTGNFPAYELVIPKDYTDVATIDADALRKHGDRVVLFADERSRAMVFTLADNRLTISALACGSGKAKASIATTWEAPVWSSGFCWDKVADFLKLSPKTAFDLQFSTEDKAGLNSRAVVFSVPGWSYILMPMRL